MLGPSLPSFVPSGLLARIAGVRLEREPGFRNDFRAWVDVDVDVDLGVVNFQAMVPSFRSFLPSFLSSPAAPRVTD